MNAQMLRAVHPLPQALRGALRFRLLLAGTARE